MSSNFETAKPAATAAAWKFDTFDAYADVEPVRQWFSEPQVEQLRRNFEWGKDAEALLARFVTTFPSN
ncbi:MAG TPA: hypothetical protein VJ276_03905 [Thermoanaerobaculia bacterium]|nr:hypothetical protein [Thermoanaerobaculia bacterium]